jgi:hypothetical protein
MRMQFFPTNFSSLRYITILLVLRSDINQSTLFRESDGEDGDELDACLQASQAEQLKLEINNLLNTSIERQPRVPSQPSNRRRSSRLTAKNST